VRDRTWPGIKCPIKYCAHVNTLVKFSGQCGGGGGGGGGCRPSPARATSRRDILDTCSFRPSYTANPNPIFNPFRSYSSKSALGARVHARRARDKSRLDKNGAYPGLTRNSASKFGAKEGFLWEIPAGYDERQGSRQAGEISARGKSRKSAHLVCIETSAGQVLMSDPAPNSWKRKFLIVFCK